MFAKSGYPCKVCLSKVFSGQDQDKHWLTSSGKKKNKPTLNYVARASSCSTVYIRQKLEERVEQIKVVTELLPGLQDPHVEYVLLRGCLSLPKFSFTLRTTNTMDFPEILTKFDKINRQALNQILGVPVSDSQWSQATLPVSLGGLGLSTPEPVKSVQFVGMY